MRRVNSRIIKICFFSQYVVLVSSKNHFPIYIQFFITKYSVTVTEYSTVTVHLTKDRKMCLSFLIDQKRVFVWFWSKF